MIIHVDLQHDVYMVLMDQIKSTILAPSPCHPNSAFSSQRTVLAGRGSFSQSKVVPLCGCTTAGQRLKQPSRQESQQANPTWQSCERNRSVHQDGAKT